MSINDRNTWHSASQGLAIDVGLRQHMISVYNYMAMGLLLTGLIAYVVASSQTMMMAIFGTPLKWVVMLAPLGMVFMLSSRIESLNFSSAQLMFWIYAGLMGLSMASVFYVFTGTSIARVFFVAASMFGAMSLYGYTTKKDLAAYGSFLLMGLIGIVIASLVNLFLQSSALHFVVSVLSVLIFTGLTAYDTQQIKEMYYSGDSEETSGKKAIMGALALYLNFINIFVSLLQLFGERR